MWTEIATFAMKTALITGSVLLIVVGLAIILMQGPRRRSGLKAESLNDHYQDLAHTLDQLILHKKVFKKKLSELKKARKKAPHVDADKTRVFVIDFLGDLKADATESLSEEVSAILTTATPEDQVFVRVESPGGTVNGYGLAAAQLERIRLSGIRLVAGIDKVAASGGYMMAAVADEIVCAPFAIVGSIGVIAPVPNFNKLLKKFDVEYNEFTAGPYKRTVSVLGENTPEGVAKFKSQLLDTHELFKNHISRYRPQMDVASVATGEYWYGHQALQLKLVDKLQTTDQWLLEKRATHQLIKVSYQRKQKWQERLSEVLSSGIVSGIQRAIIQLQRQDLH
jgi:serine protease SohB